MIDLEHRIEIKNMKRIIFNEYINIPKDFTGFHLDRRGTMWWFKNGKCHRIDGPAKEWHNGDTSWAIYGYFFLEEDEYCKYKKRYM